MSVSKRVAANINAAAEERPSPEEIEATIAKAKIALEPDTNVGKHKEHDRFAPPIHLDGWNERGSEDSARTA